MVMYQQKYIGELLNKFQMKNCNSVSNPSETNSNKQNSPKWYKGKHQLTLIFLRKTKNKLK